MIELFLDYLRYERNRSQQTVERYEKSLRDFEAYFQRLDADISWASVDADVIRGWMEYLMDRGCMASTVNTELSALRSFFRFALTRQLVERDPAHALTGPKKRKPLPQFVKENEMNELLDEEQWTDSFDDILARTIIILLYEAGLRRAELAALNNADVDMMAMQLKVTGKRNKQRMVPFGTELAQQLEQYVTERDARPRQDSEALFVDKRGRRLTGGQIYYLVRKHLSRVTMMKKRSPHVLRHSFATALLNHGAGLESVRQLLGHESLETTQIYTHTTFEQLKRVYENTHPRGGQQ